MKKSIIICLLVCIVIGYKSFAHSVQFAYSVSCSGLLTLYVEHWHGDANPGSTTMTITLKVNGIDTTIVSTPFVNIENVPFDSLPNYGGPINLFASCPDNANTYNDWVVCQFPNIACGDSVMITILSGNSVFTEGGCVNIFPASTPLFVVPCFPALAVNNPPAVCFPHSVDITAPAVTAGSTGSGSFTYWADSSTTIPLTSPDSITVSGTYYIKYGISDGCMDIKPVNVTVNPKPVATFSIQQETSELYCDAKIVAHINGGIGISQYQWLDSAQNVLSVVDSVTSLCSGNYSLFIVDSNNCSNTYTQSIQLGPLPPTPQICIATADSTHTYSLLVWQKTNLDTTVIDSFIVYRETTPNNYVAIAAVHADSLSIYNDFNANPSLSAYRYKLKTKNAQGVLSNFGNYHQTIYLTNNGSTFSWTAYEVENDTTLSVVYKVYRDNASTGNFQLITTIGNDSTSYTDPNFSSYPYASYYVEAIIGNGCIPERSAYLFSRSNVVVFGTTSVNSIESTHLIHFYPNPANNKFKIEGIKGSTVVKLYDLFGKLVIEKETKNDIEILTGNLSEGLYILATQSELGKSFNKVLIKH